MGDMTWTVLLVVAGTILSVLVGTLGQLGSDEFKAWTPIVTGFLLRRAVSLLPKEVRAHYAEEWAVELDFVPGHVGKWIAAIGYVIAAKAAAKDRRVIPMNLTGRVVKRCIDRVGSLTLLVLCAPAMTIVAALVKLDGGPVLSKQLRVGRGGHTFHVLKFRTLYPDIESLMDDAVARDLRTRRQRGTTQTPCVDPRVTAVGRFLSATCLDEIPQLLNVLRGEMSLVGPRPMAPLALSLYGDDVTYYLAATPGITGLSQVSRLRTTSYQRRVQLDVAYVRGWSLRADFHILWRTLVVALRDPTGERSSDG